MRSALKAGFVYFAIVFAVGFLLGAVRVLALAPRFGEVLAVAIELPVILAVSWVVCQKLVARYSVSRDLGPRATMGGLAFGLLIFAEVAVSVFGFDRAIAEYVEHYQTAAAAIGLVGQIAFALFPVIQSFRGGGLAAKE